MFTLMVKRQGNPPYWYPAYAVDTNVGEDKAAMQGMKEYWDERPDTLETKVVEDKTTTCDEHGDAAERVERYLHRE
jgi:hypothetical protein